MVLPLAPEFLQQILCAHQVIVEDLAGDIEEVADERIAYGVSHAHACFPADHNVVSPQDAQLLREARLTNAQRQLQFLDALVTSHKPFKNSDAHRVRQGFEKHRLEPLQFSNDISPHRKTIPRSRAAVRDRSA